MREIKDTVRSTVRIGYDGRVHKTFRGTDREHRYRTEMRVLRHLENAGCSFVPRLLDHDDKNLSIVTTNCGAPVERISDRKLDALFSELETFGVTHDDPHVRNVTYDHRAGRFCVIDFELATLHSDADGQTDD